MVVELALHIDALERPYLNIEGFFHLGMSGVCRYVDMSESFIIATLKNIKSDNIIFCPETKVGLVVSVFRGYLLSLSTEKCLFFAATLNKLPYNFSYKEDIFEMIKQTYIAKESWINQKFSFLLSDEKKMNKVKSTVPTKNCPHQKIIDIYHQTLPELPRVKSWNPTKRNHLTARWREDKDRQSLDWWYNFFVNNIRNSNFLMGKKSEWRANLDWIVKRENFSKILNGQYIDRTFKSENERNIDSAIKTLDMEKKADNFFPVNFVSV
ncbi:MAG: hypothetical protein ACOCWG_02850 [bacterium]